jgi:hypothetical protein
VRRLGAGSSALILRGHVVHDLAPQNRDLGGRLDSKTHTAAIAGEHDNLDTVADQNRVADFSAENQHC